MQMIGVDKIICTSIITKQIIWFLGRTNKQNVSQEFDIRMDDKHIKKTQNRKLLGIHIDDKHSWSSHIDHLCSIISSKISLLRQLSKYVLTDFKKKFYQGYVLLLIDYGSVVWGTTSSSNLDRISKLQKRAAQIILHADFNTPSAEIIKDLSWLPIVNRLKYNKAVFTYKAMKNLTPSISQIYWSQ